MLVLDFPINTTVFSDLGFRSRALLSDTAQSPNPATQLPRQ